MNRFIVRAFSLLLLACSAAALADEPAAAGTTEPPDEIEILVTANLGEAFSSMGVEAALDALDAELAKAIADSEARRGRRPGLLDVGGFAAIELPEGPGGRSVNIPVETPYTFGAAPLFVRHRYDAIAIGRRDMALTPAGFRRMEMNRYGALPLLGGLKKAETGELVAGAASIEAKREGATPFAAWNVGKALPALFFGRGSELAPNEAPEEAAATEGEVQVGPMISIGETRLGEVAPDVPIGGADVSIIRTADGAPGAMALGEGVAGVGAGASLSLATLRRDATGDGAWRLAKAETHWSAPTDIVEIVFNQQDFDDEKLGAMFGVTIKEMSSARRYFPPEFESAYGDAGTTVAEVAAFGAESWRHVFRVEVRYPQSAESWYLWAMVDEDGSNVSLRAAGYFPIGQMLVSPQAVADALEKAAREGTLDEPIEGEELLADAMPELRRAVKACLSLY